MFTGRKLPITLAFVMLIGLAFGASCNGFFTDPTLTSVTVQPPSSQVEFGKTANALQAWGVDENGHRKLLTSGVAWSSDKPTIVSIDDKGVPTGAGLGTATITASAQGLNGTGTVIAFLGNISDLKITPTSASEPTTGGDAFFNAIATSNGKDLDVTTGATWTVTPTPASGAINRTDDGTNPPETCTVDPNTTVGTYTITVTYPGTSIMPTATLNVTP